MSFLSTQRCFNIKNLCRSRNLQLNCNRFCQLSKNPTDDVEQPRKFVPFLDMIKLRRTEAKKSILVQVQSSQSYKELHSYCSSVGTVKHMYHYSVGVEPMNFIIVEFGNEDDVHNILSTSSHFDDPQIIPVHSNFLWFRASSGKSAKLRHHKSPILTIENGNQTIKLNEIQNLLMNADSISDQMQILYEQTKLNDTGIRLRFLTAKQIESCVLGMFPNASALPFGSSVNGCGKMGCDLDLVLRLCDDKRDQNARLIYHCKAASGSERTTAQRNMEAIGDLIQLFLPGCAQVRRILQARVPIIKYYQQLTDVECDLSMSNMSGVHMSDFLYVMGAIDDRARPLIFTVRKWAAEVGLTNSSPGRWITNFSLTLLVLAFLQKPVYTPPILPSLNTLVKLSTSRDKYITEDGINCTFLRNIDNYKTKTQNKENSESLLREFFEFCSQFDFDTKAICLNEAVALTKPEHCAMYIVNPLERGLNVSKNVSLEELERFKVEARNAAWILESTNDQKNGNWGLLSIFENKRKLNLHFSTRAGRLMEVSTLFEEEPAAAVDFKNDNVRKQVENIKKEHQQNLEQLNR